MNNSDKAWFLNTINQVSEYYGRPPLSDMILNMYFSGLEKYSAGQVEKALQAHMQDPQQGQFMPKIADLVRHLDIGEPKLDEVIALATSKTTPFGVMAAIYIGSHDLLKQDVNYLRQRAREILHKLPEWKERYGAGIYTDHEMFTLIKYGIKPNEPFMPGLSPPDNLNELRGQYARVKAGGDYRALQSDQDDTVNQDGIDKIKLLVKGLTDEKELP